MGLQQCLQATKGKGGGKRQQALASRRIRSSSFAASLFFRTFKHRIGLD